MLINIPELVNSKRDIQVRPVRERMGSIVAYRRILLAVLREIKREVNESVLPAYAADKKIQHDSADWFSSLKIVAEKAVTSAIEKTSKLFGGDSDRHWSRFTGVIKSATNILIPKAARPPDDRILQAYIEKNASLIKSLSDNTIQRVERIILDAKLSGSSVAQVSLQLQYAFGIMKRRADLIAIDQMASLNSDLNEARLKGVGINEYTWRGQLDNRERKLHISLEGNRYRFGFPTGAENGLPPGKPIRCRCVAAGVIAGRSHRKAPPRSGIIAGLAAAGIAAALASNEDETE